MHFVIEFAFLHYHRLCHNHVFSIQVLELLPTPSDDDAIITNLKVLFGRILCENLSFFEKCFEDLVPSHINHRR